MRVAVYARVSSDDQQERGTIENQLEFARKYCDLHQLEVVEWYKDDSVSGTIPLEEREDGSKVLIDAKSKRYDLLLIYKLDRLGRSARIILNAVHELEQNGVQVRSMTEPFDTGNPNGRFILTMLAGVADLERETILERMWHGANRAARQGKWLGGIVPYGYKINEEGYLEINSESNEKMSEADVIKLIFHLISEQKYSTIKVADHLNALGIPPHYTRDNRQLKKGKRKTNTIGIWHPGRIRTIITNTTYMGVHKYGQRSNKQREIISREVPAIVSKEIWEKAQQVLKENQLFSKKNAVRQYLLSGLIKCGNCGANYHGTAFNGPKGKLKSYYQCNGKINYISKRTNRCVSKNLSGTWIEELVWNYCVSFINNPSQAIEELTASLDHQEQTRDWNEDLSLLNKSLEDLELEKESILDLFRKKMISSSDLEKQFNKISMEKEQISNQIVEIQSILDFEKNRYQGFQSVEELLTSLKQKIKNNITHEEKKEIVRSLVKQITVHSHENEKGRLEASVSIKFFTDSVENSNVVKYTDMDS